MAPGPGPGPGPLRILDVYRTGEIRPTVPELLQMVDGLIDGGRASAAEVHYLRGVRAALEWVEGGGNPCGQIGVGKTRGGDDAR